MDNNFGKFHLTIINFDFDMIDFDKIRHQN
jgi:hypothetical protein